MVGVIAAMFSYVQQQASIEETKRATNEITAKDEHDWGIKVIDLYLNKQELFDFTKNPKNAALNLRVLSAVAPKEVQGILDVELSRVPPPSTENDSNRLNSLQAVAEVQETLSKSTLTTKKVPVSDKPASFTVYVQYAPGDKAVASKAQNALLELGYQVPGIEEVRTVPSSLQVRYYKSDQKPLAAELAVILGKRLGLSAGPDNAIQVVSSKQLPGGILEVWIPR
jgi:hypothetical protein